MSSSLPSRSSDGDDRRKAKRARTETGATSNAVTTAGSIGIGSSASAAGLVVTCTDLAAPEDDSSAQEPEILSPIKVATNPYRKNDESSVAAESSSSSSAVGMSGTAACHGLSASSKNRATNAAAAAATAAAAAVDFTLSDDSDDEPEMLQPEAVPVAPVAATSTSSTANTSKPVKHKGASSSPSSSSKAAADTEDIKPNSKPSSSTKPTSQSQGIPGPIRPKPVPALRSNPFDTSGPRWSTYNSTLLIRSAPPCKGPKGSDAPTKVAAFDMDGTVLLTLYVRFASNLSDYELWSASVVDQIRRLYDEDGYRLLLITNQGGIRTQLDGKKAKLIRSVIDWLAFTIDRPLNAIASCSKTNGMHKPMPGMWSVAEQKFNGGKEFDLANSFYVGDSYDPNDSQGGVDKGFAQNVGEMRDGTLKFYTPEEYWGSSDYERRCAAKAAKADSEQYETPPPTALKARAALCGGYYTQSCPVMLILMGVQGCGKSTFCNAVMDSANGRQWVQLSQDTINGGKPGKREAVERAALDHLQSGGAAAKSVIIDRMHLTPDQRAHFIKVARDANAPCHLLWFDMPKSVIERRVKSRTGHAGGVEGDSGAKMALRSLAQLVPPLYEEGIDLISRVRSQEEVRSIACSYGAVGAVSASFISSTNNMSTTHLIAQDFVLKTECGEEKEKVTMPSIALGTMNMGKRVAGNLVASALRAGVRAVDTAPTYMNENEVGEGMKKGSSTEPFVIVKVPKRATTADEARCEILSSLDRLGLSKANLIILHWPCDFIDSKTLGSVWHELEAMVSEGLATAVGVSNFSVGALRALLPLCRTSYPAVNQVERHPLLPQWDLVDYCHTHGIILQAHTALGQGKDELLKHPTIVSTAQEYRLSVPDMLLRWNLSHGVAVVTKCSSYERQKAAGEQKHRLPASVMEKLDSIGYDSKPYRFVNVPFMYRPGAPYSWGNTFQK